MWFWVESYTSTKNINKEYKYSLMEKYILYPDIRNELIVFVNDNDLWKYNTENKYLERLTNGIGKLAVL